MRAPTTTAGRLLLAALPFALATLVFPACGGRREAATHGDHADAKPHADDDAHGDAGHAEPAGHEEARADGRDGIPLASFRGLTFLPVPAPQPEGAFYPGEAVGDEAAEAVLSAPVSGVVSGAPHPPGRPVAAGTPLATIASPELAELKARWLTARARRERALREKEREERLAASGATSARELEASREEAATAAAEEEAARLGLEARGLAPEEAGATYVVKAPASGTVVSWRVRRGQGVAAGEELGRLQAGAASLVRLELPLPGSAWARGDATEVRSSDGRRWSARVEGLPARLTDDTRRLEYRLRLSGAPLPVPGKPVEVRVPFPAAVILPQEALQQVEGTWGVFVREDGHARFRPVRRGTELGGDVTVVEGVAPGETVVSEGAYLLKASLLKGKGGGDEHGH